MRQGGKGLKQQLPFPIPATSGLCFTRSLLQQILPMPEAAEIALGDSYLQFTALALAKGFAVPNYFALQRVHGNNLFTRNLNRTFTNARILCLTAFWLRTNFPFLSSFSHKLFAAGLSNYWQVHQTDRQTQEVIEKYLGSLPLLDRLKIRARSCYYYLRADSTD